MITEHTASNTLATIRLPRQRCLKCGGKMSFLFNASAHESFVCDDGWCGFLLGTHDGKRFFQWSPGRMNPKYTRVMKNTYIPDGWLAVSLKEAP